MGRARKVVIPTDMITCVKNHGRGTVIHGIKFLAWGDGDGLPPSFYIILGMRPERNSGFPFMFYSPSWVEAVVSSIHSRTGVDAPSILRGAIRLYCAWRQIAGGCLNSTGLLG